MKILANKEIKHFFLAISICMAFFLCLSQATILILHKKFSLPILLISTLTIYNILLIFTLLSICYRYFYKQNTTMETAVSKINAYLSGDTNARIECDKEGEMYHLFHSINTLAAVLNAHAANEVKSKEFLKNIISDISHQIKTPLAALNIYNGLLQSEIESCNDETIHQTKQKLSEFVTLSENELDRIEMLVQNLLKITKLDAGMITIEKAPENVSEMMKDIKLHFEYRAKQEHKNINLNGSDDVTLSCDRDWITEAVGNIVKNALDHMKEGDTVSIEWKQSPSAVQIIVKDSGSGIHPDDMYHIFKRFYRSKFSKDIQGTGLGLPLAKAIIEAHNGTVEVDSELGVGTSFVIIFLTNPVNEPSVKKYKEQSLPFTTKL